VPLPETLPIGDGWIKIMETLTGKTIDQIRA
jgi:hypothetical protein